MLRRTWQGEGAERVAARVSGTLSTPGFLRLRVSLVVNGEHRHRLVAVGFSPLAIVPTTVDPPGARPSRVLLV